MPSLNTISEGGGGSQWNNKGKKSKRSKKKVESKDMIFGMKFR